ncbi:MAG TPA: hypothetical protein VHY91_16855 [Pirellulales bacterium]|jgi:hypothetical protein|nr:hypothetical protein [Pirellulales bacterium]HEX4145179.1 hypothetical protein [Pirellulales bacterium]
MAVSSISSSLASIITPSSPADTSTAAPATQSALDGGSAAGGSSAAFRQVVSQFDMHDISPREFSSLVQQLSSAGAISASDQQELNQMRVQMDLSGAPPDEPLDLVKFFQKQAQGVSDVAANNSSSETSDYTNTSQRQLEWAQKFATIQSSSSQEGVNTVV